MRYRCSIYDIPTISVARIDDRWVTADNRRLWVFRQLYRLGKCNTVPVLETYGLPSAKMTSYNKGVDIQVRRDPGGRWHRQPSKRSSTLIEKKETRILFNEPSANLSFGSAPPTSKAGHNVSSKDQYLVGINSETDSETDSEPTDSETTDNHVAVSIESYDITGDFASRSSDMNESDVPTWRTYVARFSAVAGIVGLILLFI